MYYVSLISQTGLHPPHFSLGVLCAIIIKNGCRFCQMSPNNSRQLALPFRRQGRFWQEVLEITGFSYCFHFDELICVYSHIGFHLDTWKNLNAKGGEKILHSTHFKMLNSNHLKELLSKSSSLKIDSCPGSSSRGLSTIIAPRSGP